MRVLNSVSSCKLLALHIRLAMAFDAPLIDTSCCHKDVMNYGEDTFTTNPPSLFVFDLAIVENCGLIELNASAMDGLSKWYFVWMEILPA